MKSGQICETSIETVGKVRGHSGAHFRWKIGNGQITIKHDDQTSNTYSVNNTASRVWEVTVAQESLDKVIKFLQKVRAEMQKPERKKTKR